MESDRAKLSLTEEILEPDLPICDAHHHLWERAPNRYFLSDLVADLGSGHNIVATVAVECGYGYRKSGTDELKPVGETEFLESVALQARSDPHDYNTYRGWHCRFRGS